jgi:hypothetical protein
MGMDPTEPGSAARGPTASDCWHTCRHRCCCCCCCCWFHRDTWYLPNRLRSVLLRLEVTEPRRNHCRPEDPEDPADPVEPVPQADDDSGLRSECGPGSDRIALRGSVSEVPAGTGSERERSTDEIVNRSRRRKGALCGARAAPGYHPAKCGVPGATPECRPSGRATRTAGR